MNVANRAPPGKRATGYVCARPKPPNDPPGNTVRATSPTTPAARAANDVDPIDALVARFNERSAGLLRDLLSELRVSQRRPTTARARHRVAPEDLEPVDEFTRERARQLLAKRTSTARGRR